MEGYQGDEASYNTKASGSGSEWPSQGIVPLTAQVLIWGSQSPQTVIREERICKVQGAEGARERDAEASQSQVCSVQASRGPRAPLPASPTPTTLQSWLVDKAGCESA